MKKNGLKFLLALSLAAMAVFSTAAVSAEDITLLDEDFVNVYTGHGLKNTMWGDPNKSTEYVNRTQWASEWGSEGWFRDVDSSLEAFAKIGVTPLANGSNTFVHHRTMVDTLPENAVVTMEVDFTTGPTPKTTSGAVTIEPVFTGSSTRLMRIYSSPSGGFKMDFSGSGWPFTPRGFDRTVGEFKMEPSTRYRALMTLSPNPDGTYQFTAELFNGDTRIAAGLMNEYQDLTSASLCAPKNVRLLVYADSKPTEEETIVYLHNIKMEASVPDTKPEAEFYPEKGKVAADPDGEFYVTFEKAVEAITADNVTISGGASVESVTMSEDGKRADFVFSSLKTATSYDVKISGVKIDGGETEFSYDWSFSTILPVSFSNAGFDWERQQSSTEIAFTAVTYDDVTESLSDSDYINGTKLYTKDISKIEELDAISGSGLGYADYPLDANINTDIRKKLNMTYMEKGNLTYKAIMKMNHYWQNGNEYNVFTVSLCNDDSSVEIKAMEMVRDWYYEHPRLMLLNTGSGWGLSYQVMNAASSAELELELKLLWNSDTEMYDAKLAFKNNTTGAVLFETEKEACLTMEQAASIDTLKIKYSLNDRGGKSLDQVRIERFSAECSSGRSLEAGTNSLLIDYKNLNPDTPFDVTFLTVSEKETDGAKVLSDINIIPFTNQTGESGTLTLPIELTEVEGMKIKVYALNGLDSCMPLMKEIIKQ